MSVNNHNGCADQQSICKRKIASIKKTLRWFSLYSIVICKGYQFNLMTSRIVFTSLLVLIASCSRTVEIPANKIGIVYKNQKAQDVVLSPGTHTIDYFAGVALYDMREQKADLNFDILFQDASAADISFSISYIPKADSMARICQKYEQPVYYNSISIIVEIELKRMVRGLLLSFNKDEFGEEELFGLIENQLKAKTPTVDIIEIKSFSPGRLSVRN
jgi:hypothetical protein